MEASTIFKGRILAFAFNNERSSVIFLKQPSQLGENTFNELLEMDLQTQTIIEKYLSSQLPSQPPFTLCISRRKGYLILAYGPSRLEIWKLGQGKGGTNHSIWVGDTKGKRGYEIQSSDISNLDGTLFFSAVGQRNIYCANVDDAIVNNNNLNISKLKLPPKVTVHDIKCHPHDYRVLAACSEGTVRIWNYNQFTELKELQITQAQTTQAITALSFSYDGQKLLVGTEQGHIYCWDGKTLGNRNILLAVYKKETQGILSLQWLNYTQSEELVCYTFDGNVKLMKLKLDVPQTMIRDQKVNKSRKQELFGNFIEQPPFTVVKNDITVFNFKQFNIGMNYFLGAHPLANFICINSVRFKMENNIQQNNQTSNPNGISFVYETQFMFLNDKLHTRVEYPVCAPQYQYSFKEMIPQQKKIFCSRLIFYIDNSEIKYYCMAKAQLRTLVNLKSLVMHDEIQFSQIDYRPKTLEFSKTLLFQITYKAQNQFARCLVAQIDIEDGTVGDNFKELPCNKSFFLGHESWTNPPLYLLYEDRQSYSIIFDETIQRDPRMCSEIEEQMKQRLNLRVERVYPTPLRDGLAVLYFLEGTLRFSKNRIQDNPPTDFQVMENTDMVFKADDNVSDVIWRSDNTNIGAVFCSDKIYLICDSLKTLKVISMQPHINQNNRILTSQWIAHSLIIQTKYQILYILINGRIGSILSIDAYEHKNILAALLWDRIVILSQNQLHRKSIEIKTKSVNLLQPIISGYIHRQNFFNESVDRDKIVQILQCFQNTCVDKTFVDDLVAANLFECAEFLITQDECRQFTLQDKLNFFIKQLNSSKLKESILNDDPLTLQRQLKDTRYKALSEQLGLALKYFQLSRSHKTSAQIGSHIKQNLPITYLSYQDRLDSGADVDIPQNQEQILKQILGNNVKVSEDTSVFQSNMQLTNHVRSTSMENQSPFLTHIDAIIKRLEGNPDPQRRALLERLKSLKSSKKIQSQSVSFGEQPYNLVFWDRPTEEDDEEDYDKNNGMMVRFFDQLSFDSIYYYLGVGGQPVAKAISNNGMAQQEEKDQDEVDPWMDAEDFKEFQDLLIYWRIDEGKGVILEDLSNYGTQGDIKTNDPHIWELLEESEPMELEDKWGKKCPPQHSVKLATDTTIQTHKKNWWKKKVIECFTIELWIKLQSPGILLSIGDTELIININQDNNLVISILGNTINFSQNKDDLKNDEEYRSEPKLDLNRWNHFCLSYEKESSQFYIYINSRDSFISQEYEIPGHIFKDKFFYLGRQQGGFSGQITEIRFWRLKYSINEVRDGYKTPLAIVSEKKKAFKMKLKQKDEKNDQQVKKFPGLMPIEGIFEKPPGFGFEKPPGFQKVPAFEKPPGFEPIQGFEKPPAFEGFEKPSGFEKPQAFEGFEKPQGFEGFEKPPGFEPVQGFDKTVGFDIPQNDIQNQNAFGFEKSGFDQIGFEKQPSIGFEGFEKQAAFDGFGEPAFQGTKSFESQQPTSFGTFDDTSPSLMQSANNFNFSNDQPAQDQNFQSGFGSEFNPRFDTFTKDVQPTADGWGTFTAKETAWVQEAKDQKDEMQQSQQLSEQKEVPKSRKSTPGNQNLGVQIQKYMDEATEDFSSGNIPHGIEQINSALELLQRYLSQASEEKLKKVQKFIVYCATYRFAFQLLIGVRQMKEVNNPKKEIFLYLVLIHLNLKPQHRISLIVKTIIQCLSTQNSALAEALHQSLIPNLEKTKPTEQDASSLVKIKAELSQLKEKQNANLLKMTCPYCLKHFHFKGLKKCSKCAKEFQMCCQTLCCVRKDQSLKCMACESVFSNQARKAKDQCPICKLNVLQ